MGYDIELFVDEVEREFLCSICGLVLKDPLETPCEHFYCRKCIVEWLPISNICPIDRKRIRAVDLKPPNRLLENLLSKLEIKCEFQKHGCQFVVKLENLDNHRATCSNNPDAEIICENGCNVQIKRREQKISCSEHYQKKIQGLSEALNDQRNENAELKYENIRLQRMVYEKEMKRIELVNLLEKKTGNKIRFQLHEGFASYTIWDTFQNMKAHHNSDIVESVDRFTNAVAQSVHPLVPSHSQFSLCVLNMNRDSLIYMGLTGRFVEDYPNIDEALVYASDGTVILHGNIIAAGEAWREGDDIMCDVRLPFSITFYKNYNEVVAVQSPQLLGMFPTIFMGHF